MVYKYVQKPSYNSTNDKILYDVVISKLCRQIICKKVLNLYIH